ncbi:MAG: 6,7-dimethyl-8-ribityllumazine synthase [Flavobacteriales bacterium]|nr:6,7-dimethyl-8-ribityllumazine synthase [Flavobacteriales bacterium]
MATVNLSDYDKSKITSTEGMKFGICVAQWNEQITNGLLEGAIQGLKENGATDQQIIVKYVPGSFELILGAQFFCESTEVDAVICLGSVIQGETKHFDFVCQAVAQGIKDVSLKYNKPVIFGVLTDNNMQQAVERSGGNKGNKGTEAAITAIQMVALQKSFN